MSLPRQVQQHAEEVNAIEQQLRGTSQDPAPAPAPENVVQSGDTFTPAPSEDLADQQPTEPNTPQPSEDGEEKWEVKYRRLKGKFDAEVPRLHRENKDLRQIVEHLQQQVMQIQATPPAPAPKVEEKKPASLITADETETYGEELIDIMRRSALEATAEMQEALETLRKEKAELQARLEALAGNSFETRVRAIVPDFDAVNSDPRWIAWLDEVDPMLRAPRRIAAQAAFDQQDAEAVKHYVELFKTTISEPTNQTQRQAELRKQVQPARTNATSVSGQQPKFYTETEISRMTDLIMRLQSRGEEDKARELEREISQAYIEGRVSG